MQIVTINKRTIIRKTVILLLCVAAGWYLKGKMTPQTPMMGMGRGDPYVLIQGVEKRDISPKKNYIGHVEAINSVDLRPQVTGYVEKVLFQEGSLVQKGDVLFIIESMKLMNEVTSEVDGVVTKILVEDGQGVEFHQPILIVE